MWYVSFYCAQAGCSLSSGELGNLDVVLQKSFFINQNQNLSSHFLFFFFQDHGTGALVISSLLDFLTFALCAPYSETTEGQQFDMLLEMVASNGRTLFKLFQVVV